MMFIQCGPGSFPMLKYPSCSFKAQTGMDLLELFAMVEFSRPQVPDVIRDERFLGSLSSRGTELPQALYRFGVELVNLTFNIAFPCCRAVVLPAVMMCARL